MLDVFRSNQQVALYRYRCAYEDALFPGLFVSLYFSSE